MNARNSVSRRRAKVVEEHEPESHERWLVSYSDMMTVLMALFVVLYAISQVDATKYEALRGSLAEGFNSTIVNESPPAESVSGEPAVAELMPPVSEFSADALKEYDALNKVRADVIDSLTESGLSGSVDFRVTEDGLVIGMVTSDLFFESASNDLNPRSVKVVDAVGLPLSSISNEISVEGHADFIPTGSKVKTNWELSSARATTVLRQMLRSGIKPVRVSAVGFGSARPLSDSKDKESLKVNRRVDIIVKSDASDVIRAQLPEIEASRESETRG